MSDLAKQWEELKVRQQMLRREAEELKQKLFALSNEPEMVRFRREREKLKKVIADLRETVEYWEWIKEQGRELPEFRREALENESVRQLLAKRLEMCRRHLKELEIKNAPTVLLERQRVLILILEAQISEVAVPMEQSISEAEEKSESARLKLKTATAILAEVETHFPQTRRQLNAAMRRAEEELNQSRLDELEWATQSLAHLAFALTQKRSDRDNLIRRYRGKFPNDDLSAIMPMPPTPAAVTTYKKPIGIRRKPRKISLDAPIQDSGQKPVRGALKPWTFRITFSPDDQGAELPCDKEGFLAKLKSALGGTACHGINPAVAYEKLMAVTKMEKETRSKLKEVLEPNPAAGWKIIRAGRKYRLFLCIDENEKCIRFFPLPRREAYLGH